MSEIAKVKDSILSIENRSLLFFEAKGFCMWPFVKENDRLIVKKVQPADLRSGDLVLYKTNGQLICHRLVKKLKTEDSYVLFVRADTLLTASERIEAGMFLGKVVGVVKKDKVANLESAKQRFLNEMILIVGPAIGVAIKIYRVLFKRR